MPRLMAFKSYPALIDLYETKKDGPLGQSYIVIEDPIALECTFAAVRGASLDTTGIFFSAEDTVKIELRPEDAKLISYESRLGNLRGKYDSTSRYSDFTMDPTSASYIYAVEQSRPVVDDRGHVVSVELYLKVSIT